MQMKQILSLFACVGVCVWTTAAEAAPTLLTIAESEHGQVVGWWPNQPGMDKTWVEGMTKQGIQILNPAEMNQMPRLSPVVYGQKPLSDKNARTMASLFGTSNILNGVVEWQCVTHETATGTHEAVRCSGQAQLTLLYGKDEAYTWQGMASAVGESFEMAKDAVRSRIMTDIALPVMAKTSSGSTGGNIPKYLDKPVILFDPLPDADTLVALRKQLKRVPGIQDVAERWVANGILALELNPDVAEMSHDEFSQLIQGFAGLTAESFMIRETHRTENGIIFEVIKY